MPRKYKAVMKETILILLILPSLIGVVLFFVAPFIISIFYAIIDNPVTARFVGFKNFIDVLTNTVFHLALKNTMIFFLICVPLNMIIPLSLALLLNKAVRYRNLFGLILLVPLVIPSGSTVFFWKSIFGLNGIINGLFYSQNPINWMDTSFARGIITLIFIWKNAGYNMVLFWAGVNFIPKEYYETAYMEGISTFQKFTRVTLVYLTPTIFLVFMMSIINSFKSFKEIYLLAGAYPNQSIYMLQHYMYNQFSASNYQKLASASYILSLIFVAIVFVMFHFQRKFSENF